LVLKGRGRDTIARTLQKINRELIFDSDVEFTIPETPRKSMPVFQLFADGRASVTTLLWIAFFANLLALNFLNNWLPTVLSGTGLPIRQAVRITTFFQFGGMAGVILMGILSDRFGYYKVLGIAFSFAAFFTALIGSIGGSLTTLAAVI